MFLYLTVPHPGSSQEHKKDSTGRSVCHIYGSFSAHPLLLPKTNSNSSVVLQRR